METTHLNENKVLAGIWFALSFCVGISAFVVLFAAASPLIRGSLCLSALGFSTILFFMGRQRLRRYRIEPERFGRILSIASAIAMMGALALLGD